MKKLLYVLMAALMLVSFVACQSAPAEQEVVEAPAEQSAPAEVEQVDETPKFPTSSITLNLTGSPGSGTDMLFRALASAIEDTSGANIVPMTAYWAPNMVATMEAPADGYTMCALPSTNICRSLVDTSSEDPNYKDIQILCTIANSSVIMGVRADDERFADVNSVSDLIAWLEANPSESLLLGAGSKSSATTIAAALMIQKENLGDRISILNSSDDNELNTSILGGTVDLFTNSAGGVNSLYQDGKVKIIASFGGERSAFFPEVKTLKECGIDVVMQNFMVVGVKKETPQELQDILIGMVEAAVEEETFVETTKNQMYEAQFYDQATTIGMLDNVTEGLVSIRDYLGWS